MIRKAALMGSGLQPCPSVAKPHGATHNVHKGYGAFREHDNITPEAEKGGVKNLSPHIPANQPTTQLKSHPPLHKILTPPLHTTSTSCPRPEPFS